MIAALLACLVAFGTTYWAGKKSLGVGLTSVLAWGFFYGIVRANLLAAPAHFIFDCAIVAFYITQSHILTGKQTKRVSGLSNWTLALVGWPCLLLFMPLQDFLVSLVGLRCAILFLPMLLIGAQLASEDLLFFGSALAMLNLVALAFGGAEYFLGIQMFYPPSEVTHIIYASNDVGGYQFWRIPAIFVTAHAYAGAMVTTIPFLYGAWCFEKGSKAKQILYLLGIAAALLGVLMASTRVHFVGAALAAVMIVLTGKFSMQRRALLVGVLSILAFFAFNNERFSRFKSLSDTDGVTERVHGSVNGTFFNALTDYPLGNGLGGGGTSIPYFLADRVRIPVMMENEYGRILLETGVIGLLIWIGFIAFFVFGSAAFKSGPWQNGRRLAWVTCCFYFGTGVMGLGMLTAIPQSVLMLLCAGWVFAKQAPDQPLKLKAVSRKVTLEMLPIANRPLGDRSHAPVS